MKNNKPPLPIIDVIIPCFNDGIYLKDCINSLRKQTYKVLRINVVDDCSTDTETLAYYNVLKSDGINIIYREKNGGIGSARNTGLQAATSAYVLLIDSDDTIKPSFVKKAVAKLDSEPETGAVSSYLTAFGDYSFKWRPTGGRVGNFLFANNCCSMSLIRRECWSNVGYFDENLRSYEDWEFWIRVTAAGWKVQIIQEFLFNYRLLNKKSNLINEGQKKHSIYFDQIVRKNSLIYEAYIAKHRPDLGIHFLIKYFGLEKTNNLYNSNRS